MELNDNDVFDLVSEIWGSVLNSEVHPAAPVTDDQASVSALIHIHGTWEGSVVISAARPLALQVAATMFDCPTADVAEDEMLDAFGEVVNMLGGSVKSVVEGPATLSLPTVIGGHAYAIPGAQQTNEAWMGCDGQWLTARVLQRADASVPAGLGA